MLTTILQNTKNAKKKEKIPFKVTLMRCVSYKIQMVENKIQHELMKNTDFSYYDNVHSDS